MGLEGLVHAGPPAHGYVMGVNGLRMGCEWGRGARLERPPLRQVRHDGQLAQRILPRHREAVLGRVWVAEGQLHQLGRAVGRV
eukprot:scaffold2891_cov118-Isochrysis_galbana.AAC.1